MTSASVSMQQVKESLSLIYHAIDDVFMHIPHDLALPLAEQFREVLLDYNLITYSQNRLLEGTQFNAFKDTRLRELRKVLQDIEKRFNGKATLKPAIDELDFLITAEILVRTD
jgi:hypothetical protein